jgi:hypothetical protein
VEQLENDVSNGQRKRQRPGNRLETNKTLGKKILKFLSTALSRTGYGFIQGFCLIFQV